MRNNIEHTNPIFELLKNENELKNLLNKYNVEVNYYQSNLKW